MSEKLQHRNSRKCVILPQPFLCYVYIRKHKRCSPSKLFCFYYSVYDNTRRTKTSKVRRKEQNREEKKKRKKRKRRKRRRRRRKRKKAHASLRIYIRRSFRVERTSISPLINFVRERASNRAALQPVRQADAAVVRRPSSVCTYRDDLSWVLRLLIVGDIFLPSPTTPLSITY